MNVRVKSLLGACVVLLMVSGGVAPAAEKKEKVDLNTASMSELESLPGIGPAIAKRIVDNRPYSSVAGLSKAGVPDATVTKLKGMVTVSRAKSESAPAKSEPAAKKEAREPARSEPKPAPARPASGGDKVDVNSASVKELQSLPGVGPAIAKRIVENRPYSSMPDLARAGVSDALLTRIRPSITVGRAEMASRAPEKKAETTTSRAPAPAAQTGNREPARTEERKASAGPVDLNTATAAELEALPGVGPAYAKRIVDNRPYASVAELSKSGLPAPTIDRIRTMVRATPPRVARASQAGNEAPVAYQPPPSRGMVWVNLNTKVFHREGDRWYGRTKNGKYMTEAEAIRAGARVSHEKDEPEKP